MVRQSVSLALLTSCALAVSTHADAPFLETATYVGTPDSSGTEHARCMTIAPDGSIYIAGNTDEIALPNALNTKSGFTDIFVIKLSSDMSTVLWSRYMGGVGAVADYEAATDCAATADGGIVVTGKTETPDFPTVNAIDDTLDGPSDAVLFKLDAEGNIEFSTYIGGSGGEYADGAGGGEFVGEVEIASDGSIFVAGDTRSADFPLVNPIDGTFGGFQDDAFLMKLTGDGQTILASTYIGDGFSDTIRGLELDAEDRPVAVGDAGPGWPHTPGAYIFGTPSSSGIVFVTKFAADAQSIEWSAVIDRVDFSGGHLSFSNLAIAPDETITVVGQATGGGFPVPDDAYRPDIASGSPTRDAIALSFSADGSQITAGTFVGVGNKGEDARTVGIDSLGQILLPVNIDSSPPRPARLYKFDPQMTTLLDGPIEMANPGGTRRIRVEADNNPVALIAGFGDTTPGAFQDEPAGFYMARWNMQNPPATPGDLTGDGVVDVFDLLELLSAWGTCSGDCAADLTGDDVVNVFDLLALLSNWS